MFWLAVAVFAVIIFLAVFADADVVTLFYEFLYRWTPYGQGDGLKGKVAWITGASSGIGEALALDLATQQCRLVLSARRKDVLQQVKESCLAVARTKDPLYQSDNILVLPFDLLDTDKHTDAASKVIAHFNEIDYLVNNAGRSQRSLANEASLDVFKALFDLDVLGQISITKAVLPYMISQRSGHVVAIGSISGKIGVPASSGYCAAKHALAGFFKALALEVASSDISVTIACPGPVETSVVENSFGKTTDEVLGTSAPKFTAALQMSVSRCAQLLSLAMRAKLKEVWLTKQPILFVTYLAQYAPAFYHLVTNNMFAKLIGAFRSVSKKD